MSRREDNKFFAEREELLKLLPMRRRSAVEDAGDHDRQSMLNFGFTVPYTTMPQSLIRRKVDDRDS